MLRGAVDTTVLDDEEEEHRQVGHPGADFGGKTRKPRRRVFGCVLALLVPAVKDGGTRERQAEDDNDDDITDRRRGREILLAATTSSGSIFVVCVVLFVCLFVC